ncbi:MAG: DUF1499 domain-containing protein [Syntrophobacteraceae bacterium]
MTVKTRFLFPAIAFFSVFFAWPPGGQTFPVGSATRMAECPDSPNCVSSLSKEKSHWIAPLAFDASPDEAFPCLKDIIRQTQRVTIVVDEEGYVRAEFRTSLGFVDDVEFELDRGNRKILMRSASRAGYWDLGVNRRRLETIRAAFDLKCK